MAATQESAKPSCRACCLLIQPGAAAQPVNPVQLPLQHRRASAALSVQEHWSVQLQSVAPRPRSVPRRPEAYGPGQTRHGSEAAPRHSGSRLLFLFKN
ncbi:hypothetical protein D4764_20G0001220 [Takifugu flavidus]|uniref:Uncharacterized protein n=1 Tax=Takifugu flavidus TaxID=433684 RepID=A0A5C6NJ55_9TELE|nr:hypothetical protein D4764_20G0001220 [Takifugu flavidus]